MQCQVVGQLKELSERDYDDKRRLLALWLFVVHSVERQVIRQWLEKETQSHLILYLDTLALAVELFEVSRHGCLFTEVTFIVSTLGEMQ